MGIKPLNPAVLMPIFYQLSIEGNVSSAMLDICSERVDEDTSLFFLFNICIKPLLKSLMKRLYYVPF